MGGWQRIVRRFRELLDVVVSGLGSGDDGDSVALTYNHSAQTFTATVDPQFDSLRLTDTTQATSTQSGSLVVSGGIGADSLVAGDIFVEGEGTIGGYSANSVAETQNIFVGNTQLWNKRQSISLVSIDGLANAAIKYKINIINNDPVFSTSNLSLVNRIFDDSQETDFRFLTGTSSVEVDFSTSAEDENNPFLNTNGITYMSGIHILTWYFNRAPDGDVWIESYVSNNATPAWVEIGRIPAGQSSHLKAGFIRYASGLPYTYGTKFRLNFESANTAPRLGTWRWFPDRPNEALNVKPRFLQESARNNVCFSETFTIRDLSGSNKSIIGRGYVKPESYTVASLPSASVLGAGAMIFVSDEIGGSIPAFSDGSAWRRINDREIVS